VQEYDHRLATKEGVMSTHCRRETSAPSTRPLRAPGIPLGTFVALLALSGCGPPADQTPEGHRPTEASIVGMRPAEDLEQDSTPMVLRRVWGARDLSLIGVSVSADGRYLTYIDWTGTNDVMVREVATGEVERVTYDGVDEPYQAAFAATISPDGRQVAYTWFSDQNAAYNYYELRVIRRGEREPRILYRSENCHDPWPMGWSPDGEEVHFLAAMMDHTRRLMSVSVEDGAVRTLKDFGSQKVGLRQSLSPQGQHVVYTLRGDIYVLDLQSGSTAPLVRHPGNDYALGWSPDGRYVLFASDRSGVLGAWVQPVDEGQAAGDPWMVKADLWRAEPIGFTRDARYFFGIPLDSRKVYVASVDPETGRILAPPTPVSGDRLAEESHPRWSPDGHYLAYTSEGGGDSGRRIIEIRDVRTGEHRELSPDLETLFNPGFLWDPGGRSLLVGGEDQEGGALFEVNVETGETHARFRPHGPETPSLGAFIGWSPDGGRVYFRSGGVDSIIALDARADEATVLFDRKVNCCPDLSPDGGQIAFAAAAAGSPALMVMPTAGGEPRIIHRFEGEDSIQGPDLVQGIAWSRDGRTLVYFRDDNSGTRAGFWRIAVDGGEPQPIGLLMDGSRPRNIRNLRIHPDGQRITFEMSESRSEVWVMENFLPEDGRGGSR
jgi:Tol biopolymer transport system component